MSSKFYLFQVAIGTEADNFFRMANSFISQGEIKSVDERDCQTVPNMAAALAEFAKHYGCVDQLKLILSDQPIKSGSNND